VFTDMTEALEAEALELTPTSDSQETDAALVVAHHARDKDDLAELLATLGLPCGENDLVLLLPHLHTDDPETGDPMPAAVPTNDAFTAVAASMLQSGDSPEHVREILGLSEDELAEALQHVDLPVSAPAAPAADDAPADEEAPAAEAAPADEDADGPETGGSEAGGEQHTNTDIPVVDSEIEALLTWGEQHDTKGVQALAARARTALAELAQRRDTEHAVASAETKVGKLKKALARAEAELRQAKAGRPTTPAAPSPAAVPDTATVPDADKEERTRIRDWARANGFTVADRGSISRQIMDAWNARSADSQDVSLAQAG